jgi:hypothetical protein
MSGSTFQQVGLSLQLIAKLAVLWIALLVLPFAERTLLGAKTYYFLYIISLLMYPVSPFHSRASNFAAGWRCSKILLDGGDPQEHR